MHTSVSRAQQRRSSSSHPLTAGSALPDAHETATINSEGRRRGSNYEDYYWMKIDYFMWIYRVNCSMGPRIDIVVFETYLVYMGRKSEYAN
ncbi:hypothetical protein JTB14_031248 [Gonioctena quinquepunctata]|nr:hypothetical protein JTB14_031248 [Gonioctena quinquepunctata]